MIFCTRQRPPNRNPSGNPRAKRPWEPAVAFLDWFSDSQSRRPYLTQLCLTPVIYCIGDFSAQMIGDDDFDPRRSLRSIVVGLVIAIPSHEWFLFLGRRFNYAYSPTISLCAKVAANQLLYTPLFNVYFFAFHGLLSGEGLMGAAERVSNTVPTSIPRSFLYWPFVTAFNFTYVQPQSRSAATSVFAVFWQSYLSWLNSSAETGAEMRIGKPASSNACAVGDLDRRLLLFDDN
ncbi:hypothetical protein ANOM_010829 [Aspergillus nomiae NRRL 13137]|uniref:Uncharacterized protein n=1 Tax=Aspergillus nomiae NRRL (strain ATCC 15546 / NRRL 13137 / CBS 260.88 / M93) TaxID=1509407 RepID=A0A0L1IM35_ASPN3|nr:uncharacterized protein ANOM_010829 [Aspergillus nomiae NRRL 13137]KNG80572.1 hypothetical protein ANOM_010829 [Aspergillus nomiae NRRL 13137]